MAFTPNTKFTSLDQAWRAYAKLILQGQPTERDELAFKGGAATLFYAMMRMFDAGGEEPTDNDLAKMDILHREIEAFSKTFDQRIIALRRPAPPRQ